MSPIVSALALAVRSGAAIELSTLEALTGEQLAQLHAIVALRIAAADLDIAATLAQTSSSDYAMVRASIDSASANIGKAESALRRVETLRAAATTTGPRR